MLHSANFRMIMLIMIVTSSVILMSVPSITKARAVSWKYRAFLTGTSEVPPVNTVATGLADFRISDNNSTLRYRVNLTGPNNVTGAHIDLGKTGQNGQIVVDLFQIGFSKHKKTSYGMILRGNITDSTLKGRLKGKTILDLLTAIEMGDIYINVHSKSHPNGEIRGQLLPINLMRSNMSADNPSTLME
jgi:hypothetical protein